ncbi:hypothetical protein DFA_06284 [Cavenderia fasciculata]|uniref:Uncharacterized protein n=1 Tax=Cavenderia fasciculata TaxID=261658 RepID=F4PKL7_CACFS|nr:uncharacterized protein DFA_06284 [Cavenderia fasciculata]EGG24141.1 hypothetical protein DFA_06284 [Cavenderia fasciculata]|eukprot:XP_004361992.1 hypothetical protein DFA_06284 [Cavenderia fasciculata]
MWSVIVVMNDNTTTTTTTSKTELFSRLLRNVIIKRYIFDQVTKISSLLLSSSHNNNSTINNHLKIYKWSQLKDNINQLSRYGYIDRIKKVLDVKNDWSIQNIVGLEMEIYHTLLI